MAIEVLVHLEHSHPVLAEDPPELIVRQDFAAVIWVLQVVRADVLPYPTHHLAPGYPSLGRSASCSGSSQLDPPNGSLACTSPSTTPSTSNATSFRDPHCGSSEPKLLPSGTLLSQQHDPRRVAGF